MTVYRHVDHRAGRSEGDSRHRRERIDYFGTRYRTWYRTPW
jgi:hypothetical protein